MKIDKKEKAVVVIGSGPGGAQVAYQLTKQGIPVVLLEAGRRITVSYTHLTLPTSNGV